MKKAIIYHFIVISAFWFVGCQTLEFPEPVNDQPKFYFKGNIDGQPIDWNAGNNNYYMFSKVEKDVQNNVSVFTGHLKEQSCNQNVECANSILLRVRNSDIGTPTANTLETGSREFVEAEVKDSFEVTYTSVSECRDKQEVHWVINDQKYAGKTVTTVFAKGQNVKTKLTSEMQGVTIMVEQMTPIISNDERCLFNISVKKVNRNYVIQVKPEKSVDVKATWKWNQGTQVSSDVVELANPSGRITGELTLGDRCHATVAILLDPNKLPENFRCSFALKYQLTRLKPHPNPTQRKRVEVIYFDQNAVAYSSRFALQDRSQLFKIEQVEDFINNDRDEKTKRVKFTLNCRLKNEKENRVIAIENATGVFAVALPQ